MSHGADPPRSIRHIATKTQYRRCIRFVSFVSMFTLPRVTHLHDSAGGTAERESFAIQTHRFAELNPIDLPHA
jgi:hypothetical protein